jgi:hypothetical protein
MTSKRRMAALFACGCVIIVAVYFASDLFDPGITSNPWFTRSYLGSIGFSLMAGYAGYWIERQERRGRRS